MSESRERDVRLKQFVVSPQISPDTVNERQPKMSPLGLVSDRIISLLIIVKVIQKA